MIKIAIADDEILFRQGIRAILQKHKDIEIVFGASDGKDLIDQLNTNAVKPDIVLTDLKMPELNGVEATKIIVEKFPEIKIIALTSYFTKPFIVNMISIGAAAYLAKNSTPKLMVETIRNVAEKGFYYDDVTLSFINKGAIPQKLEKLPVFEEKIFSKRETEVLELICKQFTTVEIAEKLFISPRTVEGHRNSLLYKSGAKNLAGLVIHAIQHNLVNVNTKF